MHEDCENEWFHALTADDIREYQTIWKDEFGEEISDDEARKSGARLLHLFELISEPDSGESEPFPALTDRERLTLAHIREILTAGGRPTARSVAKAIGCSSSRSGARAIKELLRKGYFAKTERVNIRSN